MASTPPYDSSVQYFGVYTEGNKKAERNVGVQKREMEESKENKSRSRNALNLKKKKKNTVCVIAFNISRWLCVFVYRHPETQVSFTGKGCIKRPLFVFLTPVEMIIYDAKAR